MPKLAQANRFFLLSALGPQLFFLVLIFVGPFVYMVWLSFTDFSFALAGQKGAFVGFKNYVRAISDDPIFWGSVRRSVVYMSLCVFPQLIFGIAVAELLAMQDRLQKVLNPILSLPILLPAVVVGLLWRLMLQGEFGIVSFYLNKMGFFTKQAVLSDIKSIMVTLSIMDFWQWAPFVVLVLLAARLSLPVAPVEAAMMDGATRFQVFRDVTLPFMFPTILVVLVIRAIDSFKEFDKVFILTGGGPGNSSELSSIYIWRVAFKQWDLGYGAALCIIVYLLIFIGVEFFTWLHGRIVRS